jgi:cyclohexa-1,5-dienecarbonyl-CoA hydratase
MIAALDAALAEHRAAPELRGVLLDHAGPHFSFGASVQEHFPGQMAGMLRSLHGLLERILRYPVPLLAAVHGQCLGGGLELALTASQIFAAPDAHFGQPEIRLGVIAPAASCLLPERIGQARAEELLFSGRSLDAGEARDAGLVQALADDPVAAARGWFETHLLPLSASSLRFAVRAARAGYVARVVEKLAVVEALCAGDLMATHDALEGLQAFVDKRPPAWRHA